MPGQYLNVLEVPVQLPAETSSRRASQQACEAGFTLNPDARYNMRPTGQRSTTPLDSPPASRCSALSLAPSAGAPPSHKAGLELSQLNENLLRFNLKEFAGSAPARWDLRQCQSLPCSRRGSVKSLLHSLRRTRSVREVRFAAAEDDEPARCLDFGKRKHRRSVAVDAPLGPPQRAQDAEDSVQLPPAPTRAPPPPPDALCAPPPPGHPPPPPPGLPLPPSPGLQPSFASPPLTVPPNEPGFLASSSPQRSYYKDSPDVSPRPDAVDLGAASRPPSALDLTKSTDASVPPRVPSPSTTRASGPPSALELPTTHPCEAATTAHPLPGISRSSTRKHRSILSSSRTSGVFSLCSAGDLSTEPSSPAQRSSQPLTPTLDGFFLGAPFNQSPVAEPDASPYAEDGPSPGLSAAPRFFAGYSLPAEQHASEQTIRPQGQDAKPAAAGPEARVEGEADARSALQELVEDMGYLGALIG